MPYSDCVLHLTSVALRSVMIERATTTWKRGGLKSSRSKKKALMSSLVMRSESNPSRRIPSTGRNTILLILTANFHHLFLNFFHKSIIESEGF